MRHLAIGDIHGCLNALMTLSKTVPFRPDDVLIPLGDYVDRGPDSRGVIDWMIERKKAGALVPLRGNHEVMMLQARQSEVDLEIWLGVGGDAALISYAAEGRLASLADVPAEHWEFVQSTLPLFETATHVFVHAGLYPDLPTSDQPDYIIYWEFFNNPPPHESGKIIVCGHTSQKYGIPKSVGHAICIDTWVVGRGWLTCFDPATGQYWQANQAGESRTGWMSDHE